MGALRQEEFVRVDILGFLGLEREFLVEGLFRALFSIL